MKNHTPMLNSRMLAPSDRFRRRDYRRERSVSETTFAAFIAS
jgi:hypothetical protein